jgi:glycosyltransferase involved in cell wall biosynthesis
VSVLLITSRNPSPPHTGDRVRATLWLEALHGTDVTIASPNEVPRTPLTWIRAASRLAREELPLHTLLGAREWHSALADAGPFDTAIVLLTRTDPWAFHAARARRWILDAIDSAAVGMTERASASRGVARAFWQSEARKAERLESDAARRYDAVVTVTPVESARFGAKSVVLPIGIDLAELGDAPRTIDFGFWGRLAYFANQDAVRAIVTRIWPRIRRQLPDATLVLGGADAPAWIRRLHGRDGITVESPMHDRSATLRRIRVALLPMSFGSGQSLKTLEAAEAGCAIVGTPLAFRGCEQLAPLAVVDEDFDRLADRALTANASPELRARVAKFYSRRATLEQMAALAGVAR